MGCNGSGGNDAGNFCYHEDILLIAELWYLQLLDSSPSVLQIQAFLGEIIMNWQSSHLVRCTVPYKTETESALLLHKHTEEGLMHIADHRAEGCATVWCSAECCKLGMFFPGKQS